MRKKFIDNVLKSMEKIDNQESKVCSDCMCPKIMAEFRIVDGKDRRNNICRTCEAERRGVELPGKNKVSKILSNLGFIICSSCGNIKHKKCFGKNKARENGLSNICKECRCQVILDN